MALIRVPFNLHFFTFFQNRQFKLKHRCLENKNVKAALSAEEMECSTMIKTFIKSSKNNTSSSKGKIQGVQKTKKK